MATVGENLRRLRLASPKVKTQRALAEAMDVLQSQLSDWERERYGMPDLVTIMKMAKALEVTVEDLVVGVDPEYD